MTAVLSLEPPPLIELVRVSKEYETGGTVVRAMREVDLSVARGEFVAIVGASGSGKSTMMNIIGCLDRPTRGTYTLAGIAVGDRSGDSRAIVRNRVIGFIFQGFNLLPRTTALENVELPLQYRGIGLRDRRKRARAVLEAVGLGDRLDHTPNQLSGGQQQRVAIARALVTDPPLLLADEPTGNLDTRTSLEVLALLQRLNRELSITIVLVTHEQEIAGCASRVVTMRDGRIVGDVVQERPLDAARELAGMPLEDRNDPGTGEGDVGGVGGAAGRTLPVGVFALMFVVQLSGSALAMLYCRGLVGLGVAKSLWIGLLAGEVTMTWAAAQWARPRFGGPTTVDQRVRIAFGYTMVVTCGLMAATLVVCALVPWRERMPSVVAQVLAVAEGGVPNAWVILAGGVFAFLCGTILLRSLLLAAFARGP